MGAAASRDGVLLFARYAYPPNELGYCGPDARAELLERATATRSGGVGASGSADAELRRLARGFEGAWPYLELIAAANGLGDPLDARVVEAYWIGGGLLRAPSAVLARSLEDRFRGRLGRRWDGLAATVPGASPHHAFHVFGVYPWLGLLRAGRVDEPLHVLDRCRIRWGQVAEVTGETAVVRSRPMVWDGRALRLGDPRPEVVTVRRDGHALSGELAVGDWCSMHWGWVCERLDAGRLRTLVRWSTRQLTVANAAPVPAPAVVLA